MSLNEETIREFFEYVLKGDYAGVKSLTESLETLSLSEYELGYLNAMKGIVSMIKDSDSNVKQYLNEDFIKSRSLKFKEVLKLGSPMIDDYDKGFFECWIKFLKTALEYLKKS
ncbi:hypothetical protein KEJ27_09500 [Candidatus Bathyarchaeota archaeon]|nr:hypothetical protein [Candidatus Bathyarchaeota archaeon]MBS7613970.1 hypothetical protein [Candidatus Bathyarchaeota archaeon]MBS7618056.1 hypothetical protein [Candidatus Bathyarchaeota archaeon]